MFATQLSLASAQVSRNTFTEITESRAPVREAALEAFRRRNAVLDAWFYDIGKITPDEAKNLSPWLAREGSILIVYPSSGGSLHLCQDIEEFADQGGKEIRALAVAGVGSSALGSAAFARNVADAFDAPVAAVVSGYGLSDLMTEAMGGWFWFRTLNGLRHNFEVLDGYARAHGSAGPGDVTGPTDAHTRDFSLDTQTVCRLLSDGRFTFSLLTGHSKGNLVISEALSDIAIRSSQLPHQPDPSTWIVTVSAAIYMPARYTRIVDVMGGIDWFGGMNSQIDVDIEEKCRLAWHHTNTDIPFHLPVTETFRKLIRERRIAL
jgi:hypothetical protein